MNLSNILWVFPTVLRILPFYYAALSYFRVTTKRCSITLTINYCIYADMSFRTVQKQRSGITAYTKVLFSERTVQYSEKAKISARLVTSALFHKTQHNCFVRLKQKVIHSQVAKTLNLGAGRGATF